MSTPHDLGAMSVEDKLELRNRYHKREILRCTRSFKHFLFHYVRTKDEHDRVTPVKPFPKKAYLEFLADEFMGDEEILYVAKSRQLMVSWLLCARVVWEIMFRPHALACFQSKKLEDAASMIFDSTPTLARCSFIVVSLPDWMKVCVCDEDGKRVLRRIPIGSSSTLFSSGQIKLPNGSMAMALAQGAAQVEGKVPSLFISDESSLQEEWRASWTAMRPCISGGGRAIAVATMRLPSAYGDEIAPCDDVDPDSVLRGVARFQTLSGGYGLRVHYSADPDKDPATEVGAEWYRNEIAGVLGGREGTEWQQHYEINPESRSGTLVLPMWDRIKTQVVVPDIPFEVARTWKLDSGFDWGVLNKTVWQVFATNYDGFRYMVHEIAVPAADIGVTGIAAMMKQSPYLALVNGRIHADPTIWNRTQSPNGAGRGVISNADLFRRQGINLVKARLRGQEADEIWLQKLVGGYWYGWEEPGWTPRFLICESCRETIVGLGRLRYQQWSNSTGNDKPLKEKFVDKRNDYLDSWKYAEVANPHVPSIQADPAEQFYSFDWLWKYTRSELGKDSSFRS
ncbi:MAG: hypothetical protein K2Q20_05680 [Phycisphaerales bacterium]|nr:hypothetical protein [Phycisphaerales bacterium]